MPSTLCTLGKFSADDMLKCYSYFSQITGFDMETICMKHFTSKSFKHKTITSRQLASAKLLLDSIVLYCEDVHLVREFWLRGYKTFFMLISNEHKIFYAN